MGTIVIIGFIQAFFFAMLSLTKKKKEVPDYILAILFATLCYQLGVNYLVVSRKIENFTQLIGTAGPMSFLYGPMLFFFIKNYISKKHIFRPRYLLHFVPFIAGYIYLFFTFYLQPQQEKIEDFNEIVNGKPDTDLAISLLLRSLLPIIYCIWSIGILKLHSESLPKPYSFKTEKLTLNWLWYLTWRMFIVGISALVLNTIIVFFDIANWVELRKIIIVIATVWVFFLGYYSIKKTPFYRSYHIDGFDTLEYDKLVKRPEKYERTRLKEKEISALKKRLMEHLEKERPYLNKNLSIGELARDLDIPDYQLSQLINDRLGQSFFELVNSCRVEEVKQRFFDPKYSNLTLLGIAMECGFNSKASFNRIFKQLTNKTLTEYIREKKAA